MLLDKIPLPNKVHFTTEEKNVSEVVIEPLYPGYGVTVGNALRRVLLSSLPGAAVTAVKIKGVDHEFSTINDVSEDVVDIILNLKQLRFVVDSREPVRLNLQVKGKKEVKAGDIKKDARVKVVNPDQVIATLDNKNSELNMEIIVEQGRGYVPVEMREAEKREIGMIAVDAVYTPIRTVNFSVENVRVGQITNFDKLTVRMETDGTITGREALDIASEILVDHFSILKTDGSRASAEEAEDGEKEEAVEGEAVAVGEDAGDLDDLGLSNRSVNALRKNGILTKEQLMNLTEEDLKNMEGLGSKSVEEIIKVIK